VEGKYFPSLAGVRDFSPNSKRTGFLPDVGHKAIVPRALRKTLMQSRNEVVLVDVSYIGMNYKGQPSLPMIILFLHQLIVSRSAAKLGWNGIFKQLKEVGIKVIHSLTRKLLKAPNGVEVLAEADLL
jgi:hypothetical protein